jgi:hypothetical protein
MSDDKKIIEGSGGKGGGGGHTPVEAADTLRSRALVRVVDLISEGEIVGLVTGDAQSIFFDDTPVKSDDGTFNFLNVQYTTREGLPTQTYIPGFASIETERVAGVPITATSSALRSVSSTAVDAVRVTIQWPNGMAEASTSNGDIKGSSVGIAIDVKLSSSGTFTNVLSTTVSGKAMSVYEKAWRVERPVGTTGFWDIRVRRTTADSTSTAIRNNFTWARYTELIDQKSTYANSAVVGIAADAQATGGNIPVRSYRVKGIKVQLPSNYNPVTRVYTGVWDGTFQAAAFTDNPAWILYDLLLNTRYGMGEFITASDVDKYSFYDAGVYNDALVSNGNGGTEPRFAFNGVIQSRDDAIKVLQAVASCMRSTLIYYGGLIRVNQDRPSSVLKTITNSDVVDGLFTYSGSSIIQRTTAVNVQFNDKNDKWLPRIISEDDTTGIARYGYNATDIAAFGCTSEGQARRLGRWTLYTNLHQVEACIWKASFNNQELSIGDVVNVSDSFYFSGSNRPFRVTALSLEEANIIRVEAVQYDSAKFTYVDNLPSNPGTGTPPDTTNEVDPVTSVQWTPVVVVEQDTTGRFASTVQSRSLRVSWTKPIGGFPVGYNFKWRRDNDNYTQVTDQATESYTILNATDGIYEAVIIAFNAKGVLSPAVTSTYTYSTSSAIAGTATLNAPTNFFVKDTTTRIWSGSDLNLEWTNPPSNAPSTPTSPIVKDFELKMYTSSGGTLIRTAIIAGVAAGSKAYFSYTYAMNVADGGPRRDLYCEVRCRDAHGLTSSAASGTFSNQAISSIPITTDNVFPAIGGYRVTYTYPPDFDFKGVLVWADTTATFTPSSANLRYNGTDSVVSITGVPEKTIWYFRIAPYDSFNNPPSLSGAGLNIFPPVGVNAIGPVSPATISNAVPTGATLPATGTEGQLFFLTTDGLLYRYHNGTWSANMTFAQIDGSLSGAQQAAINLANLTGTIRTTQIGSSTISTAMLQAAAVQTANLAAGAVTAGTIAAGAITSDKIAANSINANNANIANLSANILTANTITGGMIQAGTISSTNIAARTITANQISTATIAADTAFLNALQVTSLQIQGDAVIVPRCTKYGFQNLSSNYGANDVLFGSNGVVILFPLHVAPKVIFVTLATVLSAPGGGNGAGFRITCELQCGGTPIASQDFLIGLANNAPKVSQTCAFSFESPTFFGDRGDYYVRFFANRTEGSGGGFALETQIATLFAMGRG